MSSQGDQDKVIFTYVRNSGKVSQCSGAFLSLSKKKWNRCIILLIVRYWWRLSSQYQVCLFLLLVISFLLGAISSLIRIVWKFFVHSFCTSIVILGRDLLSNFHKSGKKIYEPMKKLEFYIRQFFKLFYSPISLVNSHLFLWKMTL